MSIGGTVIEVIDLSDKGLVWIDTKDSCHSHCSIYVKRTVQSRCISEGDSVWWQGQIAMWTPRSVANEKLLEDIKLEKEGPSINRCDL